MSRTVPGYQSFGRIFLKTDQEKQRGEVSLQSTPSQFNLKIFAPVVGSVLYEVRADAQQFMMLDFQEDQYVLDDNNPLTRQQWLGVDLELEELNWVVWGRMTHSQFQEWQGQFLSPKQIRLVKTFVVIDIMLNEEGLMKTMIKREASLVIYEVEIEEYQTIKDQQYPYKINIRDANASNMLKFVFTDIQIPEKSFPTLNFIAPEDMSPMWKTESKTKTQPSDPDL
ncbi:lipoprotein insertase outer membrane protein LolB [Deltaproteobacteria bacterium TL4]